MSVIAVAAKATAINGVLPFMIFSFRMFRADPDPLSAMPV